MLETLTLTTTRHALAAVLGAALLLATPCLALADGATRPAPSAPRVPEDPAYRDGVSAIKRGDFAAAIPLLEGVVARDGKNADAYNWLGYAIRRSGDARRAIPIYEKALAIDPKHRGAHEYLGEAYLVLGDLGKAKEHLAVLDRLCFLPCEEYSDLKKAVQVYEQSGGQTRPASTR